MPPAAPAVRGRTASGGLEAPACLVAMFFVGSKIFPAVGRLLVFAELRHVYKRADEVDVISINVPVLMCAEWLNGTFSIA